jgi:D-alanyl-D-alanine carboxypeptidase/D-alanyl-D-alanine-endopeptidase (penicillin-binding protein 4)
MFSSVFRSFVTLSLLLATLAGLALPVAAQPAAPVGALPPGVSAALARAGVPASAFSALVVSLDASAQERLRYRASTSVNPASVMKLVTTYAAIDLLGPDFTWNTRFYSEGEVSQGVLRGNLYVRGGGDPKLVLERIQAAFMNLQDQGVRVILGDLVLDHSAFELPAMDPGAFDGEALRPYNASPDALLVNFKSVVLTFQPDTAADQNSLSRGNQGQIAEQLPQIVAHHAPDTMDWRQGFGLLPGARFDSRATA